MSLNSGVRRHREEDRIEAWLGRIPDQDLRAHADEKRSADPTRVGLIRADLVGCESQQNDKIKGDEALLGARHWWSPRRAADPLRAPSCRLSEDHPDEHRPRGNAG